MPLRWWLLLCFVGSVFGNTEIINLGATESASVDLAFTDSWPVLRPDAHDLQLNVSSAPFGFVHSEGICQNLPEWKLANGQACPYETWIVLDLDAKSWRAFHRFTVRLSWPAFYPTDIKITAFDPPHLLPSKIPLTSRKTRRKYARIQFIHAGVFTPSFHTVDRDRRHQVPIFVTLEPLYFGILPASVTPVVFALLFTGFLGFRISLKLNSYFQTIGQRAREETTKILPRRL